jgi:hypothetical protein
VGRVRCRGMVDLGWAAFGDQASVSLGPRRELRIGLHPVYESGLVAPLEELAHCGPVRGREHEGPHSGFGVPAGARPEGAAAVGKNLDGQIAFSDGGLPANAEHPQEERGQKAPGSNAKTCDGDDWHSCWKPGAFHSNWFKSVSGAG